MTQTTKENACPNRSFFGGYSHNFVAISEQQKPTRDILDLFTSMNGYMVDKLTSEKHLYCICKKCGKVIKP